MDWVAELSGRFGREEGLPHSAEANPNQTERGRERNREGRGEEGELCRDSSSYFIRLTTTRGGEGEREREGTERVDGEEGTSSASPPHHIEMHRCITNILR